MGHWGMCPPLEFDARKILQPFFVSTYRPSTHIKALIAVTVAGCCKKNFSHIRFCRPDARWLSLLDDFVTTNFGTRAPRAHAPPPGAKFWRRHGFHATDSVAYDWPAGMTCFYWSRLEAYCCLSLSINVRPTSRQRPHNASSVPVALLAASRLAQLSACLSPPLVDATTKNSLVKVA